MKVLSVDLLCASSPFVSWGISTLRTGFGLYLPYLSFFLSIYLPHLPQLVPSSYWTLVCYATLSLAVA